MELRKRPLQAEYSSGRFISIYYFILSRWQSGGTERDELVHSHLNRLASVSTGDTGSRGGGLAGGARDRDRYSTHGGGNVSANELRRVWRRIASLSRETGGIECEKGKRQGVSLALLLVETGLPLASAQRKAAPSLTGQNGESAPFQSAGVASPPTATPSSCLSGRPLAPKTEYVDHCYSDHSPSVSLTSPLSLRCLPISSLLRVRPEILVQLPFSMFEPFRRSKRET